jgi:ubiquinone/menaquinone biosynthesis C-methylase UbiE
VRRDVYGPPPPRVVSRRAFLGLGRREPPPPRPVADAWLRALEPVEAALGEGGLRVPLGTPDLPQLPYPDGGFESVRSCFGAAAAPSPGRMARELVRVVRPGGEVAMTAWSPRSLPGRLDECDWGDQEVMTRRLGPLLEGLELRTRSVQLRFPDADAMAAALAVTPQMREHFDRLLASCNNRPEGVEVDARYLLAMGRRPA